MRRLVSSVPPITVLAAAAAMFLVIPGMIDRYAIAQQKARVTLAREVLGEDDILRRIDRAITMLPDQLDIVLDDMDDLLDKIPEKIEARAEDIEEWATRIVLGFVENLDVYSMIMSNMMQYDERRLEELIKRSTNEQLNYIKYLGGALGALGGLVIWQPLPALVAFSVVGSLLYGADEVLFRLRPSRNGS